MKSENFVTTAATTTQDIDLDAMATLVQEFKRKFPPSQKAPEHIVMTDECWEALKSHEEIWEVHCPRGFGPVSHIYGIPVEHFPTEAECLKRAFELWREHGLKVMLVSAK